MNDSSSRASQSTISSTISPAARSGRPEQIAQCPYSRRSKAKRCMRTMTTTKSCRTSTGYHAHEGSWGGGRVPRRRVLGPHMGTCHSKSVSRRHLTISWDPDRAQWQLYADKNGVVVDTVWKRGRRSTFFTSRLPGSAPARATSSCPAARASPSLPLLPWRRPAAAATTTTAAVAAAAAVGPPCENQPCVGCNSITAFAKSWLCPR